MSDDLIARLIERMPVVIAGARMRHTDIVVTPDEMEALLAALSAQGWTARWHRCSGCGHRWENRPARAGEWTVAELCGDCWRTAQPVLHALGETVGDETVERWRDRMGPWHDAAASSLPTTPPQHAVAPCGHVIAATYGTKCQLPICAGDREAALQHEGRR